MALAGDLAARFAARAPRHDREGSFPHENFADLHASGYLALSIPREFGGAGATILELTLAQERLARGDASTALGAAMHLSILGRLGQAVLAGGAAARHRRGVDAGALRPGGADGDRGGGPDQLGRLRAGDGEPQPGRAPGDDGRAGRGTAGGARGVRHHRAEDLHHDGSGPALHPALGHRRGSRWAGRRAVPARAGPVPGLRVEETWDTVGMRASGSHDLVLEGVRVPAGALLTRRPYGAPAAPAAAGRARRRPGRAPAAPALAGRNGTPPRGRGGPP